MAKAVCFVEVGEAQRIRLWTEIGGGLRLWGMKGEIVIDGEAMEGVVTVGGEAEGGFVVEDHVLSVIGVRFRLRRGRKWS